IWVMAVKAAPGSLLIRSPMMRRWALEEIGRNSVRPCTRPKIKASVHVTAVKGNLPWTGTLTSMESRRVGTSGLRVSSVGLGTMTWGRDTDEHEAADLLREFLD